MVEIGTQIGVAAFAWIHINFPGEKHEFLLQLVAIVSVFFLFNTLNFCRGYRATAWIVMVLIQSTIDLYAFFIIVGAMVFFAAVSFHVLLAPIERDGDEDDITFGTRTFSKALLTVFDMLLFGQFGVEGFEQSVNEPLSICLFVFFMVMVTVVSLNALIALLGDSFDNVQMRANLERNRIRASLAVEYLDFMPPRVALDIEKKCTWLLVPKAVNGRDAEKKSSELWNGKINVLRNEIKASLNVLSQKHDDSIKVWSAMERSVGLLREEMRLKMRNLSCAN